MGGPRREDGALVVTTPASSGKVERLRRDPRVVLRQAGPPVILRLRG
ncbi:hypothetical protein ACQPX6_23395 [Actinomycetospora sp. CA-101289]